VTTRLSSTTGRLLSLSALLVAGVVVIHASVPETPKTTRTPLSRLPAAVGPWQSAGNIAIDDDSLKVLKADDYVSRFYVRGASAVELFVAYYATQRQGDTMHSPMNCLPASGWEPMSTARIQIPMSAGPAMNANRVVIQKGLDKELILYWYQSHGRTIASEYASKAYLVLDSIRQHRSDAALVRIVTPLTAPEAVADRAAIDFVQSLRPLLGSHVPD
jgi:EpsI family protein